MFDSLFNLMGTMFILIGVGFFLRRAGFVSDEVKKALTDFLLYVILPASIIKSFLMDVGNDIWVTVIVLLAIACFVQVIAMILARTLFRKLPPDQIPCFQYATVATNSVFFGLPISEGVFGSIGLLYSSLFLLPQRFVMWTAGASFFHAGESKLNAYKKILVHPCMIGTYIGLAILVGNIPLPGVILSTIKSVASANTALTMIFIGITIADCRLREILSAQMLLFSFLRLFLIPFLTLVPCLLLHIDSLTTGVAVLMTAMPSASTTTVMAAKYGKDEVMGAKIVVVTTLLSMVTIPLWSFYLMGAF